MSSNSLPLVLLEIESPCPMNLDVLPRDGAGIHCPLCNKTVHDIAQMSHAQAQSLLADDTQPICIRVSRDKATGQVITLDYARPGIVRGRSPWSLILSVISVAAAAMGFTLTRPMQTAGIRRIRLPAPTPVVASPMSQIAIPTPAPPPPPETPADGQP